MSKSQQLVSNTEIEASSVLEPDALPELGESTLDSAVETSEEVPFSLPETTPNRPISMQDLEDVPVTISAVLGKKKINVASLLALGEGAIIDIDRKVGEPIDLYINDTLIARGELVMVDGTLGVSMTEVIQDNLPYDNISGV